VSIGQYRTGKGGGQALQKPNIIRQSITKPN